MGAYFERQIYFLYIGCSDGPILKNISFYMAKLRAAQASQSQDQATAGSNRTQGILPTRLGSGQRTFQEHAPADAQVSGQCSATSHSPGGSRRRPLYHSALFWCLGGASLSKKDQKRVPMRAPKTHCGVPIVRARSQHFFFAGALRLEGGPPVQCWC